MVNDIVILTFETKYFSQTSIQMYICI